MSRKCAVTGKGVMSGNNVSHANNRTRRRFLPNLQEISFQSDTLNRAVRLRVCVKAMRSIDRVGGIDVFLLGARSVDLSKEALSVRRQIQRQQSNSKASA